MDTQSGPHKFGVRALSVRNMIKKVAMIGGGVIGGGWAARFLLNGLDVYVYDPDPNAEQTLLEVIDNARFSLPMLYESKLPNEGKIKFCKNVAQAVVDADWIQESVPERLNVKHDVYEEIQTSCKTSAIIASSTSGFKPSELQENSKAPEKIIVCHPFNPVYLLPLIEVVGSDKTSARDIKKAMDVLKKLGFFPLHVRKEIDAHLADRFLEAVWREALWLIKEWDETKSEDDVLEESIDLSPYMVEAVNNKIGEEIANVTGTGVVGTGDDPVHWRKKKKKEVLKRFNVNLAN